LPIVVLVDAPAETPELAEDAWAVAVPLTVITPVTPLFAMPVAVVPLPPVAFPVTLTVAVLLPMFIPETLVADPPTTLPVIFQVPPAEIVPPYAAEAPPPLMLAVIVNVPVPEWLRPDAEAEAADPWIAAALIIAVTPDVFVMVRQVVVPA
jgi:hypothetical protein